MMQMSPPASPRVSGSHLLARGSSLGGASGHHAHRGVVRRQLVAVHESVTVLEVRLVEWMVWEWFSMVSLTPGGRV
jgi:hypothetical protein